MFKTVKILLVGLLLFNFCFDAHAKSHRNYRQAKGLTAKSALLWDITENKIYFDRNSQQRVFPASTTKVMTVLLALEKLSLQDYVTVSARSTQVQQTNLGFRAGEEYRVSDLVYACLLKSANDAAGVLAEAVGGTQENFVVMMNKKALEIGAVNTRFANPHGLPSKEEQFTTAKDMAIIFKEALKYPFFQSASSFRYRIIYSKAGRRHFLKSHNKSLFLNWKKDVYGKTGYTRQAQSCFVGYYKSGQRTFIVDVFGCRNQKRWDDIKWIIEKYSKTDV